MNKPDNIEQWAWDKAYIIARRAHCILNVYFDVNGVVNTYLGEPAAKALITYIAHALMEAKEFGAKTQQG